MSWTEEESSIRGNPPNANHSRHPGSVIAHLAFSPRSFFTGPPPNSGEVERHGDGSFPSARAPGRETQMGHLKRSISEVRAKWAQQKNLYEASGGQKGVGWRAGPLSFLWGAEGFSWFYWGGVFFVFFQGKPAGKPKPLFLGGVQPRNCWAQLKEGVCIPC